MPELPEVETIKNTLLPVVKNNTILSIDVIREKTIISGADEFKKSLENETFLNVTRRGKFLIFHLTNNKVFISHLRMEGKYYDLKENEANSKYAKVVFHLSNNHKLCYDDSRCFGIMILSNENDYMNLEEIKKLGKEPWEISDVNYLIKETKNKKGPIKTALLDQTLITGLGNIYVDETLYESKIHPNTNTNRLLKSDWENIVKNSQMILSKAIEMGGSTIKSYHPGKGIDGNFQTRIKIYGKKDEICPICGHRFRFTKIGGRGTTFCPGCQKKLGGPITVGVTGKISTGKSLITETFKLKGYDTISSDEIVASLYKQKDISKHIEKMFNLKFNSESVNKDILREYLINNPNDKKKLERYIHPKVIKVVDEFLTKKGTDIKVVEVPLLFESGMENMFDYIIAPIMDNDKQYQLIKNRDKSKADNLKKINSTNEFNFYKEKVEYLINNNSTVSDFRKSINKVIKDLENNL